MSSNWNGLVHVVRRALTGAAVALTLTLAVPAAATTHLAPAASAAPCQRPGCNGEAVYEGICAADLDADSPPNDVCGACGYRHLPPYCPSPAQIEAHLRGGR